MDGTPKVFLEKNGKRSEVQVEKRLQGGKESFWFVGKIQQPQALQAREERDDEPVPEHEDDPNFEEVEPEELQIEKIMRLTEKATTLASENEELKKTIQELTAKIALHEATIVDMMQRNGAMKKNNHPDCPMH